LAASSCSDFDQSLTFQALGFERMMCPGAHRIETAVVLTLGEVKGDAPLLRIHPQCLTGEDVLGSLRCDGGDQLECSGFPIFEANSIWNRAPALSVTERLRGHHCMAFL